MRRPSSPVILVIAALVVGSAGCVDTGNRHASAVGTAGELPDRAGFCLALTRAVNAVEAGAPDIAREAATALSPTAAWQSPPGSPHRPTARVASTLATAGPTSALRPRWSSCRCRP